MICEKSDFRDENSTIWENYKWGLVCWNLNCFCDLVTEVFWERDYSVITDKQKIVMEDMQMAVVNLNKDNFSKEVLENKGITLIDFFASWCMPCKMLSPIVDEVAQEMQDVTVGKVNIDEQQELAMQFGIMSIPTLVALQDGKEVKRSVGFISKQGMKDLLKV